MPDGNPLVAQAQSTTTAVTGIGILESAQDLANGVSDGSWVEAGLGGLGMGLEVLSMVIDPLGTLASYGVSWLIEHVRPLKEALDWFAGDPPVIQSFSDTWANVAKEVNAVSADYLTQAKSGTSGWTGGAADAYRGHAAEAADAVAGAGTLADGISVGVMIMGQVVSFVREFIRDIVGELVGRLIAWAIEEACTLGLATPLVVAQATTAISKVVNKVTDVVRKLVKTISNVAPRLKKIISKLDEIIEKLAKLMRKADNGKAPHSGTSPSKVDGSPSSPNGTTSPSSATSPSSTSTPSTHPPDSSTTPSSPDTPSTPDTTSPSSTKPPDTSKPKDPDARGNTDPAKDGRANDGKCTGGDPVDLATGEMLMSQTDVEIPGVLPFVLRRTHISTYRLGRSFGSSWASTVDQRVELDADGVCYVGADGVTLTYPTPPATGAPVLPSHGARWPLRATSATEFTITNPVDGQTRHFGFPASSGATRRVLLSAITDRNGNRITIGRDTTGTPTTVDHSGGYRIAVDATDGRITGLRMVRAGGGDIPLVGYHYDTDARLSAVGNSSGRVMRFDYDSDSRVTKWTDRNGHWYSYDYDHTGRVVRADGSGGALACSIEYDQQNRVTTYRNSLGAVSTYHFTENWQLAREVDPLGATTRFEHDDYGRITAKTDQLGHTTRFEYGLTDEPTRITHPDGSSVTTVQDEHGLPVTITDADGAQWTYRHDDRGNIVEETDPLGAVTRYGYTELGHRRTETDALGNVHRIETDARGLPVTVTNPLGHTTRFTRDELGRVTATVDPLGNTTRTTWTVEGKPLTRTRPDGTTEHWRHDPEGNFAEYSIGDGPLLSVATTHFDLPVAQVNADGSRVEFGYDTELNLTTVTNAQGLVWRYEYDLAGCLVRETDFNGRVTTYERDAAGQLVGRTNGAGQTTTYHRDVRGNVVTVQSPTDAMTFGYDPVGRIMSATNSDATVAMTRNAIGRVLTETVNGRTVTTEYDPLGRCVRRRTPSGAVTTWEFDAAGTPVALHNGNRTVAFAYDAAGRETARTAPSGLRIAQSWDANDQLASQTVLGRNAGVPTQHRTFRYRQDGNVTDISDQINGRRGFDLDPFGRITRVNGQRWSESYQYDVAGNLTNAAAQGAPPSAQWRYTGTLLHEAGALRYQYDPQGRVTRKERGAEVWHYTWNTDDQLIGLVTPDNAHWRYRYDALGRRIAKERLAQGQVVERVEFVWDGTTLAEQITDRQSISWDYDPSSHRPLVQVERAGIDERFYAIVTDLVGAPTELVDEHGNVVWFAQTTAWGRPIAHGGAATTPLRFPGQYSDQESGLNYNYFRYYDPETARYFSADPIGLAGGYAPHSYVPNPLVWLDPLGLALLDVIKNGVRIVVHEYDADRPGHAHVTGGGPPREVRIGPNGHPIDGQPELSRAQRAVVEHYKAEIRKAVRKLGRRNQAEERAERAEAERKAAAKKPCDG
jgi:RHS repeat-associated protein